MKFSKKPPKQFISEVLVLIFYCVILAVNSACNSALDKRFVVLVRDKPFVFSEQKLVVIFSVERKICAFGKPHNAEEAVIAHLARAEMES